MYLKACEACDYEIEIGGQSDVVPLINSVVDLGTLKLGVLPPGIHTTMGIKIVVRVPLTATITEVSDPEAESINVVTTALLAVTLLVKHR
jgi:hypothetical protein